MISWSESWLIRCMLFWEWRTTFAAVLGRPFEPGKGYIEPGVALLFIL